jgi:hypothetical protein
MIVARCDHQRGVMVALIVPFSALEYMRQYPPASIEDSQSEDSAVFPGFRRKGVLRPGMLM